MSFRWVNLCLTCCNQYLVLPVHVFLKLRPSVRHTVCIIVNFMTHIYRFVCFLLEQQCTCESICKIKTLTCSIKVNPSQNKMQRTTSLSLCFLCEHLVFVSSVLILGDLVRKEIKSNLISFFFPSPIKIVTPCSGKEQGIVSKTNLCEDEFDKKIHQFFFLANTYFCLGLQILASSIFSILWAKSDSLIN